jgi:hypothetical protein
LFPLFSTGVIEISGKLTAVVIETRGNLSPVLMTPRTGGKFTAGVVDTGGEVGHAFIFANFFAKKMKIPQCYF